MKKRYIFLIIILLLAGALAYLGRATADPNRPITWGATFEKEFAKNLGLSWPAAYLAIFDDLKIKNIRIAARWTDVEPREGEYNFTDLDWQIEQAAIRNVKVILAVGQKLPRWPECYIPGWAAGNQDALLKYIETTVNQYKDNSVIYAWQVENEPFLLFGECPKFDVKLLDAEIALVKKLDSRPIIITDSGEFSLWVSAAKRADIFGTTLYRRIWHEYLGFFEYPIPPSFFRVKERITRWFVGQAKPFIVVELQGEPWTHKQIYEISPEEQIALLSFKEFGETLDYAKQAGFNEYYFWGVEWWYYLKENNHPEYWEYIKNMIAK
ncbi:endo-1,4-beta-xylanase [Patescibacteria group bacterium]|nr:endo-1,4-beta-xylanase [Patescibacteria group bacterium]